MAMVVQRGADLEFTVQLQKDGEPKVLGEDAAITMFLMRLEPDDDGNNILASHVQDSSWPGANWALGLLVLRMPRANTTQLPFTGPVLCKLLVQEGSSGEETITPWPQFLLRCEAPPV